MSLLAENPYGITLVRDEFSGFFKQLDRYHQGGKGDIQTFLETHGGYSICVDRKTGERYLSADTPSLAKIGGVQTEVFRTIVKNDSELLTSGFIARFLMAFPPPEPILWNDNTVDAAVMSSYEGLINKILSYRGYLTPEQPGIITLAPEAWALIKGFQNQLAEKTLSTSNAGVISALNKAGMHCARLALNLHVIKFAANANIAPHFERVSKDTMQEAIALTEWFLNESFRVYAMFSGSVEPEDRTTMKVKTKIRQLGGRATYRDLHSGIALFHDMKAEEVKNRLREMVDTGLLSIQTETAKNGRDVEYYTLSTLNIINILDGNGRVSSNGSASIGGGADDSDGEVSENSVDALSVDSVDNADEADGGENSVDNPDDVSEEK